MVKISPRTFANSVLAARVSTAAALPSPNLGTFSTGIEALNILLKGGFPRGRITELAGPVSSGRTALLFSTLARATRQGETIAYVDAFNSFDPESAAKAGIELKRLLWIRCQSSVERALQAGDIVSRAGGFGMIALDLEPAAPAGQTGRSLKTSYHCWLRLKQAIEGTPTALLVLTREPVAGNLSSLVMTLSRKQISRQTASGLLQPAFPSCHLFQRLDTEVQILRGNFNGHASFCCRFQ
jgi:hypothetical protein